MSIKLKAIKELPKAKRKEVGSEYSNTIRQFLEEESKYAEVIKEDVKAVSLSSALRGRISKNEEFKGKVGVRVISKKVYLEKL